MAAPLLTLSKVYITYFLFMCINAENTLICGYICLYFSEIENGNSKKFFCTLDLLRILHLFCDLQETSAFIKIFFNASQSTYESEKVVNFYGFPDKNEATSTRELFQQ